MKIAKTKDKLKKRPTQLQHTYFSWLQIRYRGASFGQSTLNCYSLYLQRRGKEIYSITVLKADLLWYFFPPTYTHFFHIFKKEKQKTKPHKHVEFIYPVRKYGENTHQSALHNRTTNLISENKTGFQASKLKLSAFLQTVFLHESERVGMGMKAVLNHPLQRENNKEFWLIIRKNFKIN